MSFVTRLLFSVFAALAAGVVVRSLPDVARYLEIREM
jgi:Family of unknown function (DUF6893)